MVAYNGDLVIGLDSAADRRIQDLTHQVGELQLEQMDYDDNSPEFNKLQSQIDSALSEIQALREQGR